MKRKITTITEEYSENGKLIKRITETTEEENILRQIDDSVPYSFQTSPLYGYQFTCRMK